MCQCRVRPWRMSHFESSCHSFRGYQPSSFASRVACAGVRKYMLVWFSSPVIWMGLYDFLLASCKWKREFVFVHHQGWDAVTWADTDSEEGAPSQTGCQKGCSYPWGAKFSQHRQRVAPLKQCRTCTSCCGCVGTVCSAHAGYELSARNSINVMYCAGRGSMALLLVSISWFSLPGAKMLLFSVSHHLESCHVYFNHPQLLTLSPAPWSIAD